MLYIVFLIWPYPAMQTVRTSYLYGAIALCLCLSTFGCQKKLSGTYVGTCENLTFEKQANITLVLDESERGISGNLSISGELMGGGPFAAKIDGRNLTFTTEDQILGKLYWSGFVDGPHIKGTYHVETSLIGKLLSGLPNQQGTWAVAK
jgi:hypothetical protein